MFQVDEIVSQLLSAAWPSRSYLSSQNWFVQDIKVHMNHKSCSAHPGKTPMGTRPQHYRSLNANQNKMPLPLPLPNNFPL